MSAEVIQIRDHQLKRAAERQAELEKQAIETANAAFPNVITLPHYHEKDK